jgi:uncharacterized membrane protein
MQSAIPDPAKPRSSIRLKYVMWVVFFLMAILVIARRDLALLDSQSFLRQRYSPIPWLMFLHGIPGALALTLGVFQFSSRLRKRHLQLHRVLGRIYVGCVVISAPVAIMVAMALPIPTLLPASIIQAGGWLVCTGTALYCVRIGRIQQHREWMIRSYPFAMIFVVARAIGFIPAIDRMGIVGVEATVWGCIAVAGLLPSLIIAWQALAASHRPVGANL